MLPRSLRAALLMLAAALAIPAAAQAADPAPFGHACTAQAGVRFCPAATLDQRVPSFDGTPIDVDVTLPAVGDGPFPTILLLHGLGGTKKDFESTDGTALGYDNVSMARRGYAVVTPTARGFGKSCGDKDSRTAGCEKGWTHIGDMRYEVRDLQYLIGRLVDENVTQPDRIGSTGISYGGGMSMMLAYLRNRVRDTDGSFSPWTSPKGTPISLTAAYPRWLWSNGASIFTRNGRANGWSTSPVGVAATAYAGGILGLPQLVGYVAPSGVDPTADLAHWLDLLNAGDITAPETQAVLKQAYDFHGVAGLSGTPAPLVMQSGWTDALFPVGQSLAPYSALLKKNPNFPVALQFGDLGHAPGSNHPDDVAAFTRQGLSFLDAWLLGTGVKPAPGSVIAYTQTCPKTASSGGGPYTAARYSKLAHGSFGFHLPRAQTVTSAGGNAALAKETNPLSGTGGDACHVYAAGRSKHTAYMAARSTGFTMLGRPVVTAKVKAKGKLIALLGRLWDVDPKTRTQRLITRGSYRVLPAQKSVSFTLDGNGWRFAKGHTILLELLGRDAPTYGTLPNAYSMKLSKLAIKIPTHDGPSKRKGIGKP
jgi:pimeloyl-ACP methyl ester carboxylesterase